VRRGAASASACASTVRHLVARFAATLRAAPPSPQDERWAMDRLAASTAALWARQSDGDRRHSVAVARHVLAAAPDAPHWVIAAALLHDVGKIDAGLGVSGRVLATVLSVCRVRNAPGALGRHLRYPATGAALLAAAGEPAEVAAWAGQHHLSAAQWTVPARWAVLLAEADHGAV
jgi:hypothetical protein